ncbi:MAG: cupredoxin domain-containing protein [Acidimicrobiales bacterium]
MRTQALIRMGALVTFVALGVSCGDDGAISSGNSASSAGTSMTATEVIKDVQFVNTEVRVKAGGQVVFDNQDTQPHTATADGGSFDTDSIAAATKKSVTFATAGTFTFHCSFHPFMKATVVVE